ncbi:Protein phosphatase methylesterase 1, partial [Galemys pyrenaicus]
VGLRKWVHLSLDTGLYGRHHEDTGTQQAANQREQQQNQQAVRVPTSSSGKNRTPAAKQLRGPGRKRDFSPVSWSQYFESMEDVEVENETGKDISFANSGSEGPVLLLLHGGGHSALSWAVFTAAIISRVQCRIVALDLRGHGETKVKNSEDLSAETMAKDVGNVVEAMYGDLPPPIMLIGHSMGGAIAVHTASANLVPSLLGLCMIDVVEGTAMDALNSMQNFLRGRPKTFKSLENAIEWSVKSGQIRNLESARVSMVGQVKQCEGITSPEGSKSIVEGIIEEEEEDEEGSESVNKRKKEDDMEEFEYSSEIQNLFMFFQTKKDHPYTWRIELAKTEKYWDGWFRGLSNLFLSCPIPKLLLLAGVDRLDKDLTIGQMQGKFQMQVLPQCGHAVHEDAPDKQVSRRNNEKVTASTSENSEFQSLRSEDDWAGSALEMMTIAWYNKPPSDILTSAVPQCISWLLVMSCAPLPHHELCYKYIAPEATVMPLSSQHPARP